MRVFALFFCGLIIMGAFLLISGCGSSKFKEDNLNAGHRNAAITAAFQGTVQDT